MNKMMPTEKFAIVDFASQSTPASGILKLVGYTFAGFFILLLVAYLSGCADFEVTKTRWSDSVEAQSAVAASISKIEQAKIKAILSWAKDKDAATQGLVLGVLLSDRTVDDMAKVVAAIHKPGPTAGEIWATGLTRSLVPLASIGFGTWLGVTSVNGMRDAAVAASAGSVVNNYNRSNNSSQGPQNVDTGNTYNVNQPDPTTSTSTGTLTGDYDIDFRVVQEPR